MVFVVAIAALLLVIGSALLLGRLVFALRIAGEVDELFAAAKVEQHPVVDQDMRGLPEPVRRWLRASNVIGTAFPVTVRLRQHGEFRMGKGKGWMPFHAEEYYSTDPPGYVWKATFRMAPFVSVTGRDRYADGHGSIEMRVLSLAPVARHAGSGLDQGALLRFLNETMWFPAAVLAPYISWEARDESSAVATMRYAGVSASATFVFDDAGRLTNMIANRFDNAKKSIVPWSTPIARHGEFAGIVAPVEGAGVWHYETGDFTYIRLRITDIEYNRPERY
ncbi:MAG TPA: DUF6544 family protein [Actinomycetota bacterium]|nr:DUF6544 family protein [Actinomycetota bacterium]